MFFSTNSRSSGGMSKRGSYAMVSSPMRSFQLYPSQRISMRQPNPTFRPATSDDAIVLAELVNYAGEGMPLYLWGLENLVPGTWYINVLAVQPQFRRQGLGARL